MLAHRWRAGHVALQRKEGEFVERVHLTQDGVELDAVDHHRRLQQAHVFGAQVAMAVNDASLRHPSMQSVALAQQHLVETVERAGRALQRKLRAQQHLAVRRLLALEARKVLGRIETNSLRAAVERGQHRHQRVDLRRPDPALRQRPIEHAFARQAAHAHQPVEGSTRRGHALRHEGEPAVLFPQHPQAEVDARREPGVQAQLLAAGGLARSQRGEVEKGVTHRLLEFEHLLADQKHPGHVGFDRLDLLARRLSRQDRLQLARWGAWCHAVTPPPSVGPPRRHLPWVCSCAMPIWHALCLCGRTRRGGLSAINNGTAPAAREPRRNTGGSFR